MCYEIKGNRKSKSSRSIIFIFCISRVVSIIVSLLAKSLSKELSSPSVLPASRIAGALRHDSRPASWKSGRFPISERARHGEWIIGTRTAVENWAILWNSSRPITYDGFRVTHVILGSRSAADLFASRGSRPRKSRGIGLVRTKSNIR